MGEGQGEGEGKRDAFFLGGLLFSLMPFLLLCRADPTLVNSYLEEIAKANGIDIDLSAGGKHRLSWLRWFGGDGTQSTITHTYTRTHVSGEPVIDLYGEGGGARLDDDLAGLVLPGTSTAVPPSNLMDGPLNPGMGGGWGAAPVNPAPAPSNVQINMDEYQQFLAFKQMQAAAAQAPQPHVAPSNPYVQAPAAQPELPPGYMLMAGGINPPAPAPVRPARLLPLSHSRCLSQCCFCGWLPGLRRCEFTRFRFRSKNTAGTVRSGRPGLPKRTRRNGSD